MAITFVKNKKRIGNYFTFTQAAQGQIRVKGNAELRQMIEVSNF